MKRLFFIFSAYWILGLACGDLQTTMAAATSGDEIRVAAGSYTPGAVQTDSFQLKPGVKIYGHFAGILKRSQGKCDTPREVIISTHVLPALTALSVLRTVSTAA